MELVDGKFEAKLDITHEDIANGKRLDCYNDPICLALKRSLGEETVYSSLYTIGVFTDSTMGAVKARSHTPSRVREWLRQYDDGKVVEPLSFELVFSDWDLLNSELEPEDVQSPSATS